MTDLRTRLDACLGHQKLEMTAQAEPGGDLAVQFSDGTTTRGWFLCPDRDPRAAILYCHAHGNTYAIGRDELIQGRPALQAPYGPDLLRAGFAVLSIDLPCFGSRAALSEPETARAALWRGKPLFGRMLAELRSAFHWLRGQAGIGPVASLGLSMGATHAYWLAALEPEIAACAHIACFADLETLVASGQDRGHGPYMMVPGLLPVARTGEIAGLVAPRPQLVCAGRQDPLTPPAALDRGLVDLTKAYRAAPDHLQTLIDPELGHAESPQMRRVVLDFLITALH